MAFIDLPEDILLNVVSNFGDLDDILSLLSTCKSLHSLSAYKHLWLTYLTYVSKYHALCCPVYDHLYSFSTVELRQTALNTHRLKMDLSSASPRITGPVLRYKYAEEEELDGAGGQLLTVIPHTRVAVMYCGGKIICRDLRRPSQSFSTDSTSMGEEFVTGQTFEYRTTELYIGFVTRQFSQQLSTISVVRIKFTEVSQSPPELLWKINVIFQPKAMFILDNTLGFISFCHLSQVHIQLIDLHDSSRAKELIIQLPDIDFSSKHYITCSVQNGELYLHLRNKTKHNIYRVEFDRNLPSSTHDNNVKEKAKSVTLFMSEESSLEGFDSLTSSLTKFKMLTRGLQMSQSDENSKLTRFTFWPMSYSDKSKCHAKRNGIEIPGQVTYSDSRNSLFLMCRSHSGTYAVMVIDTSPSSNKNLELCLLHFDSETGRITRRKLDVPKCVSLKEVYSISMEERTGTIYLADVHGWLFGLKYGGTDNEE